MQEFLHMGGYAAFVWSAFAVTFIVLLFNVVVAHRHHHKAAIRARRRQTSLS